MRLEDNLEMLRERSDEMRHKWGTAAKDVDSDMENELKAEFGEKQHRYNLQKSKSSSRRYSLLSL